MKIIKNDDKNEQLSQHFESQEFTCKCGVCRISLISEELIEKLEIVRNLYGFPMIINCGYRCPAHNRSMESDPKYMAAKYSQHMAGNAVDLVLPQASRQEVFCKIIGAVFQYHYIKYTANIIHADITKRS
jgi:uncharacterized protein YcbK (DUF882 family)